MQVHFFICGSKLTNRISALFRLLQIVPLCESVFKYPPSFSSSDEASIIFNGISNTLIIHPNGILHGPSLKLKNVSQRFTIVYRCSPFTFFLVSPLQHRRCNSQPCHHRRVHRFVASLLFLRAPSKFVIKSSISRHSPRVTSIV